MPWSHHGPERPPPVRRLRFLVPSGSFREGPGGHLALPYEEGRHVRVSLRGKPGLVVQLFDGEGKEYRAQVSAVTPTQVQVVLLGEESDPVEAPLPVIALQALSHDESFEHAVDQMATLGVSAIVPLLVERSKMGGRPPDAKRLMRWQRIAREACKLSWRRVVPRIEEPAAPAQVSALVSPGALPLLLDTESRAGSFRAVLEGPRPDLVILAIGPEGGFSEPERDDLLRAGFRPVSLGPRVLRTEHAGAAAISILLAAWGDMG